MQSIQPQFLIASRYRGKPRGRTQVAVADLKPMQPHCIYTAKGRADEVVHPSRGC